VIKKLADKFEKLGGIFYFNSKVKLRGKGNEVTVLVGKDKIFTAKVVINSAGAYASELAK
jgi:L-2-hydroxyglutarate oxidase LhgO